jgi:hypothetical protein
VDSIDADVAVQQLIRGLLFLGGAIVFGLFATWLAGWLCRRSKLPPGLTLAAQILTPVALLYGASLYLDVAGQVVQARVAKTEERIAHHTSGRSIPGNWSRSFWASVTFDTPDGPGMAPLWLDETTYDALQPGTSLAVRHLPWLPFIARPADQSTLALVPWKWLAAVLAALAIVLTLRPVLRSVLRPAPAWLKALIILTSIAVAIIWFVFPAPWVTPLDPPVLTAQADVLKVREETRSFLSGRTSGSVPAPQPWNIVELQFVPEGRQKPVIAVDSVDAGSVANLQAGARLPVSYSKSNPRDARLAGTRTWRWKEWIELADFALWGVIVIAGMTLLGKAASAWWRRIVRPS